MWLGFGQWEGPNSPGEWKQLNLRRVLYPKVFEWSDRKLKDQQRIKLAAHRSWYEKGGEKMLERSPVMVKGLIVAEDRCQKDP